VAEKGLFFVKRPFCIGETCLPDVGPQEDGCIKTAYRVGLLHMLKQRLWREQGL